MKLSQGISSDETTFFYLAWVDQNGVQQETEIKATIEGDKGRKLNLWVNGVRVAEVGTK